MLNKELQDKLKKLPDDIVIDGLIDIVVIPYYYDGRGVDANIDEKSIVTLHYKNKEKIQFYFGNLYDVAEQCNGDYEKCLDFIKFDEIYNKNIEMKKNILEELHNICKSICEDKETPKKEDIYSIDWACPMGSGYVFWSGYYRSKYKGIKEAIKWKRKFLAEKKEEMKKLKYKFSEDDYRMELYIHIIDVK